MQGVSGGVLSSASDDEVGGLQARCANAQRVGRASLSRLVRTALTATRARVAERQTRWLQVPVSARTWGFKSPLAHIVLRSQTANRRRPCRYLLTGC
jgi:hypothetical protein